MHNTEIKIPIKILFQYTFKRNILLWIKNIDFIIYGIQQ